MGKKPKYSAEEKISILDEVLRDGAPKVMAKYNISQDAIHRWRLLYKYQGLSGLQTEQRYQSYSREFKQSLVEKYLRSNESQLLFAIKHGLRSKTQLQSWIIQYNESNLKAYMPGKRDSKMSGRKTSFEERLTIIEELIKHDVNYNWAVETYHVSYQQVYGWYQKYLKCGNNPESLRDR
ncbi:helix-turn-helix domain-containing protein, partial [Limosilactobacillus reuteri]|uniref:helix-turn-helix domain-containing protein n=1 Tax=Limosilactobacillus reuteri TaxID=1598 RepID=UPI001E44E1AE